LFNIGLPTLHFDDAAFLHHIDCAFWSLFTDAFHLDEMFNLIRPTPTAASCPKRVA
jgi:hypothetical protein